MISPLWPVPEAWQYAWQSIFGRVQFIIKGKIIDYLASWGSFSLSTAWWTLQSAAPQVGCLVSKSDCNFDGEKSGIMRLAELMEIWLQHRAERIIPSFAVFLALLCRDSASISLQHHSQCWLLRCICTSCLKDVPMFTWEAERGKESYLFVLNGTWNSLRRQNIKTFP